MKINKYLIYIFSIVSINIYSQQDSILLEKIKNIDVSLNSFQNEEELLYTPEVSFESFYNELSPYGDWIMMTADEIEEEVMEGEGQGFREDNDKLIMIWKPKLNNTDWRPFVNGRWEYTEQGWLWISDDPWGSSTFHYGRWYNSAKYGWLWLPGYVWSPAWVSWKETDNNIGWVSLTPLVKWKGSDGISIDDYKAANQNTDWVFVDKTKFLEQVSAGNSLSKEKNKQIAANSRAYINLKVDNNKVINHGPDVKEIEKVTGRKIQIKKINPTFDKRPIITNDEVKLSKHEFKKIGIKKAKEKNLFIDAPKKFKKTPKAKRIFHRIFRKRK